MILGTSWDIWNDPGIFCSLPINYLKVVWLLFWLFFQDGYWSQKKLDCYCTGIQDPCVWEVLNVHFQHKCNQKSKSHFAFKTVVLENIHVPLTKAE